MSLQNTPRQRVPVRTASPYIELELDIDFDSPEPESKPVVAPEPSPAEPQSVKSAIIKWLETRC